VRRAIDVAGHMVSAKQVIALVRQRLLQVTPWCFQSRVH
jgi:hypothetical protein